MSRGSEMCLIRVGLLLTAALTTLSCGTAAARKGAISSDEPEEIAVVPVARVQRSTLSSDLVLTGEFIPYQEIDVMAKEAGYIRSIRVDIGDHVREGQMLAELEIPEIQSDIDRAGANVEAAAAEIAAAKGNLTRAQSAHDIAQLSYRRIQDVGKKEPGLIPQQEIDVAHSKELESAAQFAAAQASLESAQRKLAMTKAEQNRWVILQKYTLITAPFNGVITKRYANTGAMIQQGTASETQAMPVVRLSQNDLLRLIVPVPESAVANVHLGAPVDVEVESLGRSFPGRVARTQEKVALSTRTMDTEIDVPNRDYTLVPGMYAQVKLQTRSSNRALTVPIDAVEDVGGRPHLYVVRDDVIRIIPVTAGLRTADMQEIRSGVSDSELVVVGRHAGLTDGQKVKAKIITRDSQAG